MSSHSGRYLSYQSSPCRLHAFILSLSPSSSPLIPSSYTRSLTSPVAEVVVLAGVEIAREKDLVQVVDLLVAQVAGREGHVHDVLPVGVVLCALGQLLISSSAQVETYPSGHTRSPNSHGRSCCGEAGWGVRGRGTSESAPRESSPCGRWGDHSCDHHCDILAIEERDGLLR